MRKLRTSTLPRLCAVIGAFVVMTLFAGPTGMAGASLRGTHPSGVDSAQRHFSITASGTQHIDWGFAWKAVETPIPKVKCTLKWSGTGSQSLTFRATRQRTLLQVFSGHPAVVAFSPQRRRAPWVTGRQVGDGDTVETIDGPAKYCGKPTEYSRKDCGRKISRSASAVQLFYLTNARGAYTRHVGITVPGISDNHPYKCPFLNGSGGELMFLQDVVPVNTYTMSFSDSASKLLRLRRGGAQSFRGTTALQGIKGWEKSWCNFLTNTLPGSGSCKVTGSISWRIRLVRVR